MGVAKKSPTFSTAQKNKVNLRNNFQHTKSSASLARTQRLEDAKKEKNARIETLNIGTLNVEENRKSAKTSHLNEPEVESPELESPNLSPKRISKLNNRDVHTT